MVDPIDNSQFRILIVDDTPANVEVLSKTLTLVGYNIAVANSAEKALSIIERVKPDLILLDVMMPGLDGFETCTQLKENVDTKDIPVIFITAKVDTDVIKVGFEVGAVDYITKPFYDEEVRARVNTHIQLKYSKDQLVKLNDHKDYVLGMAAHDLRNPLSLIIGYTEILEEELLPENNADHLNLLTSILSASKAMKKLIDDLLDVTAINKCALALKLEAGNLSDLVRKAKELAEISASSKDITIDVQTDGDGRVQV